MKKLGLICMALVLALGTLGVGYAMWSDTITIDGTVKTGSVDLVVTRTSGDEVFKDLDTGALVYCHWVKIGAGAASHSATHPTNGLLVAWTDAVDNGDDTVTISYNNLFPLIPIGGWGGFITDVRIHYVGSIPVHLKMTPVVTGIPSSWVTIKYWVDNNGVPVPGLQGVTDISGIQLHNSYEVTVGIIVTVPQYLTEAENEPSMGITNGQITLDLMAHQWNETP